MNVPNTRTDSAIEAETTHSEMRWPSEELFVIKDFETLKKVRILKGDWLGIYQGIHFGFSQGTLSQELLCASRSLDVLYRKLKKMGVIFPILARRAKSKKILPREIKPSEPDRLTKLCRSAYEAVAYARHLLDPDAFSLPSARLKSFEWFVYELRSIDSVIDGTEAKQLSAALSQLRDRLLKIEDRIRDWNRIRLFEYSELSSQFLNASRLAREENKFRVNTTRAQNKVDKFLVESEERVARRFEIMWRAADFQRTLANAARSKGGKAGDRPTGAEFRKALGVLHQLAEGVPMKAIAQVAINGEVDDAASLKKYKSLDILVTRFSKRVGQAVRERCGSGIKSLDYNHLFYALDNWSWIDRRRDRLALMEAARRGLPHVRIV